MAIFTAKPILSFDMIGPYLISRVICPCCKKENVLGHIESYNSPVKPISICAHLSAKDEDEDGEHFYEFESNCSNERY